MKFTIIGASPVCPNPGGASSGYLFETGDTRVLVDCGPGVISQLQLRVRLADLTAVVITHLHADHFLDLVPLRYGLLYAPDASRQQPLPLYLPPGGIDRMDALARAMEGKDAPDWWSGVVERREYDPTRRLSLGGLEFQFVAVQHYIPAWGLRVTSDGRTVAYSSDSGPTRGLVELARQADLFVCEATLPGREEDEGEWGHLAPEEAGTTAREAGVKRLMLTHMWHGTNREGMRRQAEATFGGPVDIALEGSVYEL